jgi:ribosomal protein S18 acetylase RimI-like enzyme
MALAIANVRHQAGRHEPIDIPAMEHYYAHLVNSDPLTDCIVAEAGGHIVGYVRTAWQDLVDGDRLYDILSVVDPVAWGLGISDAFIDWSEARQREVALEHPTERRAWFGLYGFNGDNEIVAALDRRGYAAVRWDAEMLRPDLEELEDVHVPDGYTLRTPTRSELPAVFEMNVAAFAEHWGASEPADQEFAGWIDDPRFRLELVVVAWAGTQPAACVTNILEEQPDGSLRGLLDSVATHPAHRRRGLARAAVAESLRRLRAAGATSAYLGVDTDNHNQALTLYESCGFRVASRGVSYRKPFDGGGTDG